jgi:hypothetical protein
VMPAHRVLYDSSELYNAIKRILSDTQQQRVAVVAFVGSGAHAFFPSPRGLRLICNPAPGSTSGLAIRRLMKRGAIVEFSDRLHMKVYWSSRKGALVTSANASANGLAAKGLYEAGVMLGSDAVDIKRIISSVKPRKPTRRDFQRLDSVPPQTPGKRAVSTGAELFDFAEWATSAHPKKWKLGWWQENVGQAVQGKESAKKIYGISRSDYWLNVSKKQCKPGDWVLTFRMTSRSVTQIRWLYVHFVVPVSKAEKAIYEADYPFQAIQAVPLRACPEPPFALSKAFKSAFRQAVAEFGIDRLGEMGDLEVPKAVMSSLRKRLVGPSGL